MRIIYLFLLLFLVGCGARKVNKSVTDEQIKTETTTEVKEVTKTDVNEVENTKIVDTSNCEEIEFIPVDNSKPMTVNGKTYLNTILKHKKTKKNITVVKDKKLSKKEDKEVKTSVKDKKEQEKKTNSKKIDKEPIPFWNFLLILLVVFSIVLFIYLEKQKDESK